MSSTNAERIVRLKERAGLDHRSLRDETGISQPALSRIISGKREPRMEEVLLLAGALGVGPSELLDDNPLEERVLAVQRATDATVDTAGVRQKLLSYLQMDEYLELHGITGSTPATQSPSGEGGQPLPTHEGYGESTARCSGANPCP